MIPSSVKSFMISAMNLDMNHTCFWKDRTAAATNSVHRYRRMIHLKLSMPCLKNGIQFRMRRYRRKTFPCSCSIAGRSRGYAVSSFIIMDIRSLNIPLRIFRNCLTPVNGIPRCMVRIYVLHMTAEYSFRQKNGFMRNWHNIRTAASRCTGTAYSGDV